MIYSHEVEAMTCVARATNHGAAPIPQEGKWTKSKEIKDINGLTHGIGWCAPQQGACKLTLNVMHGREPVCHDLADGELEIAVAAACKFALRLLYALARKGGV